MITPEEISLTVFKWWEPLLRSSLLGNNNFFPKRIDRIGKIKAQDLTQRFDEIKSYISTPKTKKARGIRKYLIPLNLW